MVQNVLFEAGSHFLAIVDELAQEQSLTFEQIASEAFSAYAQVLGDALWVDLAEPETGSASSLA